ncbi:DUF3219 family protein [Bacillus sp. FJAT-44742]|uniref:DUF3219 family protein n=1 Tax=Bacillus sp. FJAT-44742 TaxID=2014005 RepID=UPI000C244E30|nr:DUF3219 family protein [Bacillus sp. FJAT-44742]
MERKVMLNDVEFLVSEFYKTETSYSPTKISFRFPVHGGEEYHDVTKLLYSPSFTVKVPEDNLQFTGNITKYATTLADFADEQQVSIFHLELTEISKSK